MESNKQVLRKFLGKSPVILDTRKRSILKDRIKIETWQKNMEYLENENSWGKREAAHPLVQTIIDGEFALPPMLYRSTDRNWFIAAYPDVVMYFYPTVDLAVGNKDLYTKTQEVEDDYQKMLDYLDQFQLNQTLTLFYIKKFYKEVLGRGLLLSEN